MRKAMQQEARGLPGTPLRHVRASVAVGGHMPSIYSGQGKGPKNGLRRSERRSFYGPKVTPKAETKWVTPPEGTLRQRMAVLRGKIAGKVRTMLGRFIGR